MRALVDTVEAIARQQPAVMLFEDAHWADPTTLEVMDLLIHRVQNIPLLVVVTHRPEFAVRWVDTASLSLSLAKLTRDWLRLFQQAKCVAVCNTAAPIGTDATSPQ